MMSTCSERIKLLMVIDSLSGGGAERQFVETVNRLDRNRFDVSVCLACREGVHLSNLDRSRISHFVCMKKRSAWDMLRLVLKLRTFIRRVGPDIVHGWLPYSNLLVAFASRGLDCRIVAGVRNSLASLEDGTCSEVIFKRGAFKIGNGIADVILGNSGTVVRELAERGYSFRKLRFVPNGIDRDTVVRAASCGGEKLEGTPSLIAVGRLKPQKGLPVLLRAVKKILPDYPELVLSVVGEGQSRAELQELACELGVKEHVRWLGFRREIYGLMKAADVFVLSSYYEGLPNVIMEAMALGMPIVSTSVDGVNELVEDGRTGVLVPPGNAEALANGIESILRDERFADALGKNAAERAGDYDFENTIPSFEALYRSLE